MEVGRGVLSFAVFAATVVHLHSSPIPASAAVQTVHSIAALIAALFLVPSVLGLRNRWFAALHVVTICGILWSVLIGGMLLARDGL